MPYCPTCKQEYAAGTSECEDCQTTLDDEWIPAQIENVKFTAEPVNFGTMGDIRIYVGAEDERRALDLLKQRQTEYDKLPDDDDTVVTDDGVAEIDENAES